MKAVQINAYGGGEVLKINDNAPKPSITKGQVLVEVYAASINPIDWKIRQGYLAQMAPLIFPATLGGDFSGVVVEVGGDVNGFKKGDEVYGSASLLGGGSGSFAEFAAASVKTIAHKPKGISHLAAASLPLAGVSAWQGLVDHLGLAKDQKILIHGGAGGIGTVAIQLAKHLGGYVATTVSAQDIDYVKNLGTDEVIDYKSQTFENFLRDYDAVFDTVGGETYLKSFKVLKKGGVIVSMVESENRELAQQYGVEAISQGTQVNSERLMKLAELVDQNVIKAQVDKVFPLEKAKEAFKHLEEGHVRGKVVLEIKKS